MPQLNTEPLDFETEEYNNQIKDAKKRSLKVHGPVGQGGNQKGEYIPYVYDFEAVKAYYDKRPQLIAKRVAEILAASQGLTINLLLDTISSSTGEFDQDGQSRGRKKEIANQIKELCIVLGPAFIKLGQAFSIRTDLISPELAESLAELQDAVPCFSNEEAF